MLERKFKYYSLWITLICIGSFILQLLIPGFTDAFMLTENALTHPWQFITAVFLHANLGHLVYNLFALVIFGLILEKLIGSNKFLILFLFSGIIANLISFSWYPNALGASGAIMGVIGALAVIRPLMIVWTFGMIMPMFVVAIIWMAGSLLGIFGFGDPTTGYLAHLSGIFIGILYGFFIRLRIKTFKENNSYFFKRKIKIPENVMRKWEWVYFGK